VSDRKLAWAALVTALVAGAAACAAALAQYRQLPFYAPVKYVSTLPESGEFPGQEFRVLSGDPPTVVSWVWDASDGDFERTDLKAGFEDAATFNDKVTFQSGLSGTWNLVRSDFGDVNPVVCGSYVAFGMADAGYNTADTAQNGIRLLNCPLSHIYVRFEQAFAGSFRPIVDGYLFVDTDDTDNDGFDFGFGANRSSGANGFSDYWDENFGIISYCETSVKIQDISETDSFYFGWSIDEAVIDAGDWAGGNTYAYFVISDAAGDLDIVTELNAGGTLNDDTGVTWADGQEIKLRVSIAPDSVSFVLNGNAVTQTNAVLDWDDGDRAGCVAGFLNSTGDSTPDPDIKFNYIEIGTQ
jgi:hypothetical protein